MQSAHLNVAVISGHFWPEPTGSAPVLTQFAEYLCGQGLSVRVVTGMPFYPQWRVYSGYRGSLARTEKMGSILVHRSWLWARPGGSTLKRVVGELTLALCALPNVVRVLRDADAVFILSPPLTYGFLALVASKLFRVHRVLVVHDVMPDTAVALGLLRNPWAIGVARWLARRAYRMADEIHTLGPGMRDRIRANAEADGKVRVVPIAIDAIELAPVSKEGNAFRQRFASNGTFAVLHTGNMGMKQDFGVMLRAAARLRDTAAVRFYVFGDGVAKEAFLRQREMLGLSNVEQHPLQERWLLPHMLSGADVVLVTQLPEVVDIVVPSKLITAMAAGAMVVAACAPDSETATLLARGEAGIVVPAGDDVALASILLRLHRREVDPEVFRRRARRLAVSEFGLDAVYGPIVGSLRRKQSAHQRVGDPRG